MSAVLTPPTQPLVRVRPQRYAGPYTIADWVAFEDTQDRKQQLRNGEFVEMAGASYDHNAITGDLYVELAIALRGTGCEALGSDQRVHIDNRNGYYPDIVVVCGEPQIDFAEAIRNPFLIVEVLSPSTAADDRGDKFADYRTRPSLQHYLLIEQTKPSIEHYEKGGSGLWTLVAEHHSLAEILTIRINGDTTISLPLASIYRRVVFPRSELSPEIDTDTDNV